MPADVTAVPASAWAGFGYVALFSMFLGFFAWNAGMAMGGVARVSQVQLLQTFVTLALSAVVNGEHIDPVTIAAAIAVVGIVALGRKAPHRAALSHLLSVAECCRNHAVESVNTFSPRSSASQRTA